jgi:hypothetical protein
LITGLGRVRGDAARAGESSERMSMVLLESGYCDCACRDCFDVTIRDAGDRDAMCHACIDAGCEPHIGECVREDAYGDDDIDDLNYGGR